MRREIVEALIDDAARRAEIAFHEARRRARARQNGQREGCTDAT